MHSGLGCLPLQRMFLPHALRILWLQAYILNIFAHTMMKYMQNYCWTSFKVVTDDVVTNNTVDDM